MFQRPSDGLLARWHAPPIPRWREAASFRTPQPSPWWRSILRVRVEQIIPHHQVCQKDKAELERQLRNENDAYSKLYRPPNWWSLAVMGIICGMVDGRSFFLTKDRPQDGVHITWARRKVWFFAIRGEF